MAHAHGDYAGKQVQVASAVDFGNERNYYAKYIFLNNQNKINLPLTIYWFVLWIMKIFLFKEIKIIFNEIQYF